MTTSKKQSKYIINDKPLDGYRQMLVSQGWKESTIKTRLNVVRRCLNLLDTPVSEIDYNSLLQLEKKLSSIKPQNIRCYLRYLGDFVCFMTGKDPFTDYIVAKAVGQNTMESTGMVFADEIDTYVEDLRRRGISEVTIECYSIRIKNMLKTLLDRDRLIRVKDIIADDLRYLRNVLREKMTKTRLKNCLWTFGSFMEFHIGRNLYYEMIGTDSEKNWDARIFDFKYGSQLREYKAYLERRGCRPSTVKTEVERVHYCYDIISNIVGEFDLDEVDEEMLTYVRSKQTRLSDRTLRTYYCIFGQFIQLIIGRNPALNLSIRWGCHDVRRKFLSEGEWSSLLSTADQTERIVLCLGAGLGLRRFEIAGLELSDIGDDRITIRGKGSGSCGKVVIKDLDPVLRSYIDQYLQYRSEVIEKYGDHSEGKLLVSDRYRAGTYMTPDQVGLMMRSLGEKAGVKDFSTHCLRRLYATSLYESSGGTLSDLNMIRVMMRHSSLNTTLGCYIAVDDRRIKSEQSKLSQRLLG